MNEFLISVASSVAAALLIFAAAEIRKAARTVGKSADSIAELAKVVGMLADHDAENRERIAALWARVFQDRSQTNDH